jgi:hypothetical protein
LTVINNERGFQKANVKAVCSVGQSTKQKRNGFIGEKGIGFKSVFAVSSTPTILSNGYRFTLSDKPDSEIKFGKIAIFHLLSELSQVISFPYG